MVQHISWWIGEEKLVGSEFDGPDADPFKIQMRAVKRACCVAFMEQMVNCYADGEDCLCNEKTADCTCFTHSSNRVQNRVSKIHLMAARLYYGSTTSNWTNKKQAMRMRETRIHWENTGDLVLKRNAALLKLKTADWGKIADDALIHLGNLMRLDVVRVETEAHSNLFDDSDEETVSVEFGQLDVGRNQSQQPQTQQPHTSAYNVADGGIENEIKNFLKQRSAHFADCKFNNHFCAFNFLF